MTEEQMMDAMAEAVAGFVARATTPLIERIARLEADLAQRPTAEAHAEVVARAAISAAAAAKPEPGPMGEKGMAGDMGPPGPAGAPGAPGEKGAPGESVPIDSVRLIVLEEIGKAVGVLPRAQDGKSVTLEEVTPLLQRMVDAIKPKDGRDGVDGKDGRDGADGKDGEPGPMGPAGERGEKGMDGIAGAPGEPGPIGERGEIGPIGEKGIDGMPGRDGRDGLAGAQGEKGMDGTNGRDGEDGLGFDDMTAVMGEDGRTVTLRFMRGDIVKDFDLPFPVPLYEGVWKQGDTYKRGAMATYGGSTWHARRDTTETPGKGADWQLAVKKGKDA